MSGILDLSDPGTGDDGADVVSGVINVLNSNLTTGVPTAGSFVAISAADADTLSLQITGTWTGTLQVYGSIDNVNRSLLTQFVNANGGATLSSFVNSAQNGIYQIDVAGIPYVYVFASSWTSGAANVSLSPTDNTGVVAIDGGSITLSNVTPGTAASALGKAEDAVHASGDVGIEILGVRVPATPAAQSSAAGDYGAIAIDPEGKLVASQYASTDHYWGANPVVLSTTTSTALKAAGAAGIRNYLTDIDIANTSATAVRVDVLDGATVIISFQVPAGTHVQHSYSVPKKGTAATALNVQLSAAVTDVRVSATGYIGL